VAEPATPSAPAPVGPWDSLDPDLKGYVENKGFKDTSAAINSYRNLEKLMGVPKERLLKLPEKADDKEGWGAVHDRLGRPDQATGYHIEVPKEGGDEKFASWAQNTFHELGLSKAQGETLAQKWNEYATGTMQQTEEAYNTEVSNQEQALKSEWGMAFDQNINMARKAAVGFGLDGDTIDKLEVSMGYAGVMKLFHSIGSKLSEDAFVAGSGTQPQGFGALTPQAAMDRMATLRADPEFVRRYTQNDANAIEEMGKLHKMAYPGDTAL
jgi:hypothetical protein